MHTHIKRRGTGGNQLTPETGECLLRWVRPGPIHVPFPQRNARQPQSVFSIVPQHRSVGGFIRREMPPARLKHSLGTHLANAGVPPQVIQQRLGHRNIQNTMVYLTVSSAFTDRVFEGALANGAVV